MACGRAKLGFWRARAPLSAPGWRPSGPLQKVSADPYFYRTSFSPTFPHSPPSALGGRAEAANPVSGGSSAVLGNGSARSEPLQKVSTDPYFYSTSSPPLFPTLRTRRSGVVLRARGSGSAARAPRSLPGLLGLGLGGLGSGSRPRGEIQAHLVGDLGLGVRLQGWGLGRRVRV